MERTTQHGAAGPDLVLENLAWVRALARRLVEDVAEADDLVQEAWLAARGREPASTGERGVRPWLGGVVRNVARRRRRAGRARTERESRSARADRTPGRAEPDALVERSEQLTEVARAVLELPEPYRRAMLLRWFEGRDAAEIARIDGVSATTVRTRIHRGRALLRDLLDQRLGGGAGQWALGLIPVAALGGADAHASAGGVAKAAALATGLLAVAGATWWAIERDGAGAPPRDRDSAMAGPSTRTRTDALPAAEGGAATLEPAPRRAQFDTGRAGAMAAAAAPDGSLGGDQGASDPGVVEGVVVLGDGTPLADVGLVLDGRADGGPLERTKTDEQGRFRMEELGDFRFEPRVISNYELPATSDRPIRPGEAPYRVEADALLLRSRAVAEPGRLAPIGRIRMEALRTEGLSGANMRTLPEPELHLDFVVPTRGTFALTAWGEEGRSYAGLVHAAPPSRVVDVDLVEDAPAFGRVAATIQHPSLPDGAELRLDSMQSEGEWRGQITRPAEATGGRAELVLGTLIPGRYTMDVSLEGSPFVGLIESRFEVDVVAGVERRVELDVREGGALRAHVRSTDRSDERRFAEIELRRAGESGWTDGTFVTLEESDTGGLNRMQGSRALIGGPPAESLPLSPGTYDVRFTHEGHGPRIERVRVLVGTFTDLEVTLEPSAREGTPR